MNAYDSIPLSLGGSPLAGERIVKFAYLDEAGIGGGPWIIVAGVLIDPDRQWQSIGGRLKEIGQQYLLPEDRADCIFHAKDIFHGSGRFGRQKYSFDTRMALLGELCRLPVQEKFPVVAGMIDMQKYRISHHGANEQELIRNAHCIAYASCVCSVDYFMRVHRPADELVTLVVENNDQAKSAIKETQRLLNGDALADYLVDHKMAPFLPITKVVDVPHFVNKADSPIMQIADVCSFVLRRQMERKGDARNLFELFAPIMVFPEPDGGRTKSDVIPSAQP